MGLRIAAAIGALLVGGAVGWWVNSDQSPTRRNRSVASSLDPDEAESVEVELVCPRPPTAWDPRPPPRIEGLSANAYQFNAPIYARPERDSEAIGIVRRGSSIPVTSNSLRGSGCSGGSWFRVDHGFVCSSDGFAISREPLDRDQKPADFTMPMPYDYAMVARRDGALRFYRVPEASEVEALSPLPESFPDVVQRSLVGDFFVAMDREEPGPDGSYLRTVRGHYVPTKELEELELPPMVGEDLSEGGMSLPIAFVYGEDRPLFRIEEGELREVGIARKHARFEVSRRIEHDGGQWVVDAEGHVLPRDHVRIAAVTPRDERVPSDVRWIHVDLAEQTIVAYEGSRPVYASLVSSGKEGYDTPRGVFRIRDKFISITMSGEDPHDGPYEVEEVPWTMYYFESYALHGAYWHDDFGQVRSHGCTNLAPADARWLFEWSDPGLPRGWHGRRLRRGTWIQLTR